jgi:hypothetical protein
MFSGGGPGSASIQAVRRTGTAGCRDLGLCDLLKNTGSGQIKAEFWGLKNNNTGVVYAKTDKGSQQNDFSIIFAEDSTQWVFTGNG